VLDLAVTGFRVARVVEHQGIAPCTSVWKVLADGVQTCISQHLCSKNGLPRRSPEGYESPPAHLCFGATAFACTNGTGEGWNPVREWTSQVLLMGAPIELFAVANRKSTRLCGFADRRPG